MISLRSKEYFITGAICFFAFKSKCESQHEIHPMEKAVWDKSDYYEGCVKGRTVSIWDQACCPWYWKMKYSALLKGSWMHWLQTFLLASQENDFPSSSHPVTHQHRTDDAVVSFIPLSFLPPHHQALLDCSPRCIVGCKWNGRINKGFAGLIVGLEVCGAV